MRGRRASPHPLALLRLLQVGTQAALAQALTSQGLRTTRQAVSRWERGQAFPSEDRLELLSVLMRLRPEQLDQLFWPFLPAAAAVASPDGRRARFTAVEHGPCAPALFGDSQRA